MKTLTAPMGWNSWDCYGASVDEETVRKNAAFMAKNLKKYGFEYIVVDIQWYEPKAKNHEYNKFAELCMDGYSRLIPSVKRFPSSKDGHGFGPLAGYVHSLGLKFGIHIMRGIPRQAVAACTKLLGTDKTARDIAKTDSICMWNTDMYGIDPSKEGAKEYYDSIFKLYADWGVDFIKCDDIAREMPKEETELILLSECLHGCGRDMVLSLSPGPALIGKASLYQQTADMWRITDDFWDKWELLYDMFSRTAAWADYVGAGCWPDADMLPIGPILQDYDRANRTKFTKDEQVTMLTLWSIFRSPLMIGGEMTGFDDFTMSLLTNEEIHKMHSNSRFAHQVWRKQVNGLEHVLWAAVSSTGGYYLAVFNVSDKNSKIEIDLSDIELYEQVTALNLWSGEKYGKGKVSNITVPLKKHGAAAFYLK